MGLIRDSSGFIFGFTVGFGAGLVSRELLPFVGEFIKPAAKGIMRAGLLGLEKLREAVARAGESFEDLAAEVNLELKEKKITQESTKPRKKAKARKPQEASTTPRPNPTVAPSIERKTA